MLPFLGEGRRFGQTGTEEAAAVQGSESKAVEEGLRGRIESNDDELSPLNSWFSLAGRPDFRPSACRSLSRKRARPSSPCKRARRIRKRSSIEHQGNEETQEETAENSFSWARWYDWAQLDKKLAEKYPNTELKITAMKTATDSAKESSPVKVDSQIKPTQDLFQLARDELSESLAFEEKLLNRIN